MEFETIADTRLASILAYLQTGSIELASATTALPIKQVRSWIADADKTGELEKYRDGLRLATINRLVELRELALAAVENRLTAGDAVLNQKTGAVIRVPVRLADATNTYKTLADEIDRLQPASKDKGKQDERLLAIAGELQGYITAKARQLVTGPVDDVSEFLEDSGKAEQVASLPSPVPVQQEMPGAGQNDGGGGE